MRKTAYEMRISDWSSDVCSSDLRHFEFYDVAAHFNPERQIGGRLLQPIVGNAFDMGEEVHRDLVTLDRRLNPGAFWRMVVGPRYENLPADRIGELLSCSRLDRKSTRLKSSH